MEKQTESRNVSQERLKKGWAADELSHPNADQRLAYEIVYLRENKEQKGITENLNEEAAKVVLTYNAVVSDNPRKVRIILRLRGKAERCNLALKVMQEAGS